MKKIYSFIFLILVCVVLNIIFYGSGIVDISNGITINNIILQWPIYRFFIEPFYAFAYYVLTMETTGYIYAFISWLFWIVLFSILFCKYKNLKLKSTIIFCFSAIFFFCSLCAAVIILPISGPKIIVPDGYKIADIHFNTISAKDRVSSISSSIKFHKKQGFTDFFVTDYNDITGYKSIPYGINSEHVFPAIKVNTEKDESLILLSQEPFECNDDIKNKSMEEIIDFAHGNDMLVIAADCWKYNNTKIEQFADLEIDGFEIYNCRHRHTEENIKQDLINICNENNLLMFGTSDWHGLGCMVNVWNLVKEKENKNMFDLLKDKPKIKVIAHDIKDGQSVIRYVFEPFYFLYMYITTTQLKYVLSFYTFILICFALLYTKPVMRVVRRAALLLSAFFSLWLFFFIAVLKYNFFYNVMISQMMVFVVGAFAVIWLIVWSSCDKNI